MRPDRDRDRDPGGRPRNARPRDGLGRPLDRAGAGAGADDASGGNAGGLGEDRIPDDLLLAGPDAARLADELLRAGRPFHAHEVLEASWKTGPAGERDLWQGLAQVAVGLTHAQRGNARGAVALLSRGVQRVRAYQAASSAAAPRRRLPLGTARTGSTWPRSWPPRTTWRRASTGTGSRASRPRTCGRA